MPGLQSLYPSILQQDRIEMMKKLPACGFDCPLTGQEEQFFTLCRMLSVAKVDALTPSGNVPRLMLADRHHPICCPAATSPTFPPQRQLRSRL
jgi:hypothetical protein